MSAWVTNEALVRLLVIGAVLAVLLCWQRLRPRRGEQSPATRAWRNVALVLLSAGLVRLLLPLAPVAFALHVEERQWGLWHAVTAPPALEALASLVVLDLAIYWQHRAFHHVPLLWRMHRVHHSDTRFDVTLGLRFHPAEILLSTIYKLALVAALGASAGVVLAYELLLAAFALFTHADIGLGARADARLRRVVVTPDWHRVHHSLYRTETDSNFGNILSVWDRVFRTHVAQPRGGHVDMRIGLREFRGADSQGLWALLRQPLARLRQPS